VPLVSGGNRHGCAPNALLNLTTASSFGAFARLFSELGISLKTTNPRAADGLENDRPRAAPKDVFDRQTRGGNSKGMRNRDDVAAAFGECKRREPRPFEPARSAVSVGERAELALAITPLLAVWPSPGRHEARSVGLPLQYRTFRWFAMGILRLFPVLGNRRDDRHDGRSVRVFRVRARVAEGPDLSLLDKLGSAPDRRRAGECS